MADAPRTADGRDDWCGWPTGSAAVEPAEARLTETHKYFHRQLDDTTAFLRRQSGSATRL
jgi:hypothetical protein